MFETLAAIILSAIVLVTNVTSTGLSTQQRQQSGVLGASTEGASTITRVIDGVKQLLGLGQPQPTINPATDDIEISGIPREAILSVAGPAGSGSAINIWHDASQARIDTVRGSQSDITLNPDGGQVLIAGDLAVSSVLAGMTYEGEIWGRGLTLNGSRLSPKTFSVSTDTGKELFVIDTVNETVTINAPVNFTEEINAPNIIGGEPAEIPPELLAHLVDYTNPHQTTAAQVGALALTGGTVTGNTVFNANLTANQFIGNGAGITNIQDSALSSNVALLNRDPQTFTGSNTFSAAGTGLTVTNTASIGTLDVSGIIQAGSGNINITTATGNIDADVIGLITGDGAGAVSSGSGLETDTDRLGLLQGCADGQLLKWVDASNIWNCAADLSGGGGATLQTAYDAGNLIATTNARDIDFTLSNDTTDSNFDIVIASGSTSQVQITRPDAGVAEAAPTQFLLIDNLDTNVAVANGMTIQAAAGGITDALDVSDAEITNAINVGDNVILGTSAVIDFTNFDVTSAGAVTAGSTVTGTTLNATTGTIQTAGTNRIDNSGNLVNIGNITGTGAITIASSGAGNDIIVNGADRFIVQDLATFQTDSEHQLSDTENILIQNTVTGTNAVDLVLSQLTNNTTSGTQRLEVLQNQPGTGVTESILTLDNADTDTGIADALIVTSAAGGITDAIDLTDTDIVNALNLGDNTILGTTPTIDLTNIDIAGDGSFTWGVNSATSGIFNLASTGDFVIQDAGTARLTVADDGSYTFDLPAGTVDYTITGLDSDSTLTLSGLNCTGNLNGGALTTNASGVVSCSDDDSGAGAATLQSAYDTGNLINTSEARDIDFELADDTTDSNFDIDIFADNTVSISRTDNASVESPAQLLLLENLDVNLTIADGILIQATNPGVVTDAIDASDTDIINAINVGDNTILGTAAVIDFSDFDVASTGQVTISDTTDLTTPSGEDLTLVGGGAGVIDLNDTVRIPTLDGTAGATSLCRNASNLLAGCSGSGGSDPSVTLQNAYVNGNTITTTEADGNIAFTLADTASDHDFIVNAAVAGNTIQFQAGGSTALTFDGNGLTAIVDDVDLTFAGTENLAVTSDLAGTVDILSVVATPSTTAGTTRGIFLQQANSANTNGLDTGILIDNADTDLTIADTIQITSAGGAITDAIDLTDTDIVNAINVGNNTILGTTAVIDFTNFDVTGGADTTWVLSAADNLRVDAFTNPNTNTAGVVDIDVDSSTSGVEGINLNYEAIGSTAAASQEALNISIVQSGTVNTRTLTGILVDMADAGTLANTSTGIRLDPSTANTSDTTIGIDITQGANAITTGIQIQGTGAGGITNAILVGNTSTGTITTALNVSDAEIVTALDVGANDIVGTTPVINFTNIDVAGDGSFTWAVNSATSGIFNLSSTGDFIIQDAGTAVLTVADDSSFTYALPAGTVDFTVSGLDADSQVIFSGLNSCDTIDTTAGGALVCGTDAGAAATTLQVAYDNGNLINTSDARDIDFELADDTTDSNLDIDIVADNTVSISRLDNTVTESPAQLLLLENLDTNLTIADGILVNVATGGVLTDAIDASDAEIANALNVGANTILGTSAVIDFTDFDVASTGQVTISDTTDLTTPSGEHLTLTAAGAGNIELSDTIDVAANTIQGTTAVINFSNFDVSSAGNITVAAGQGLDTNAVGALNIGTTNANLVNFTEDIDVVWTGAENLNITSSLTTDSAVNLAQILFTHNVADTTTQRLLFLQNVDDGAAAAGTIERLLGLDNADTNEAVTTGLLISSAAGTIGTAIDISDADLGTGISLGANDITGTSAVIDFSDFDVASTGQVTISDTTDITTPSGEDLTLNAAGTGGIVLGDVVSVTGTMTFSGVATDLTTAATEDLTLQAGTSGVIDLNDTVRIPTLDGTAGATALCRNASNLLAGCSANPNSVTLQQAYDAGNTITTTTARDIDLTLADSATDSNLDIVIASGSTSQVQITRPDAGVGEAAPTQFLLIDNQDVNVAVANGITIQAAAGGITDGLDVSDAELTNALSVGDNTILGGSAVIDFTNFDVTGAGAVTAASTITGTTLNATTGTVQTNSTNRIDNTGNLVNIGNITGTGAITIVSSGAGNDIIINGADILDVQDAATFASTATFNGLATFNTDVDLTLAETENLSITNTVTGTNAVDLISSILTNNTTSGTQQVALLRNAAGTGATENLLVLDNADTDTAVTNGLQVTSAAGLITTALDVSDAEIGTALSFGANDVTGTNFTVTGSSGNVDTAGTIQAGSSNVTLTLSTGFIDADALTLTTSGGAGAAFSNSGLEVVSDGLTLLKGCTDGQILKWDDVTDIRWECAADSTGGAASLQGAYDGGNTITTTSARDIDITLADSATDSNLDIDIAPDSTSTVSISRNDGADTNFPTQLLLLENLDATGTLANGILFNVATGGVLTDALDASDADIVNALSVGDNTILGGSAVIDFTNFDVTGAGAVTAGSTITGTTLNATTGTIQTNSTNRIDNTGNLVNIGNITGTGAITIASSGAGNDIIINGADIFDIQDATTFASTATFNGLATFNTDVDLALAETENLSIANTVTGTNAVDLVSTVLTNNTTSGTQQVALLRNAAGTGATETLLVLDNADTDTAVATGLLLSSAAGTITTGIDLSDADLGTGISLGANDITGTTAVINFSNFDVASTGQLTFSGVATDINTASGESLTLEGTAGGEVIVNDTLQVATLGTTGTTALCRNASNQLATCDSGVSAATLQSAYDNGNSITTTSARDIDITLADSATDSNLDIVIASGSTSQVQITRPDAGVAEVAPTQFLLIDNLDTDVGVANGITIQAAAGGITDAIDASDAEIVNALNVGANTILGTSAVIDFTDFDVAATGQVTISDTTDITTPSGENLTLTAAGAGLIELADTVDVAANTIQGTTAVINFTNFDVAGDGSFTFANTGASNSIINLTSTGDFTVQDAGTNVLTVFDSGTVQVDVAGGQVFQISGTSGVTEIRDDVDFLFSTSENFRVTSSVSTDSAVNAVEFVQTNSSATDTTTQRVLLVQNADDGGTTGAVDVLGLFDHADANETLANGVIIQGSAAGTMTTALLVQNTSTGAVTTALDVSDAEIATALAIGANDISTSGGNGINVTCSGGNFLQNLVANSGIVTGGTCAAGGSSTLQGAYDAGNTISTTSARDIAFTLADSATDSNFTVTIADNATGTVSISRASGAGTVDPAQLLLLDNLDADRAVADGLKIQAAAGGITDAIDASDAEITNALNAGDNIILGTTTTIDFTNFDVTGAGAVTAAGNINTTGGVLQTNSTTRVDNTGNLVNIGNITGTGAITIASSGAGNDIIINGADIFDIQDATTFASTATFNGVVTANTDVDFVFAEAENFRVTSSLTTNVGLNVGEFILTHNVADGTAQQILLLQNANDGAAAAGTIDAGLSIDNADVNEAITNAILVTSAAGGITTAINLTDSDIGTGISLGANDIVGTTAVIDFTNFDVSSAGTVTIAGGQSYTSTGVTNIASTGAGNDVIINGADILDIQDATTFASTATFNTDVDLTLAETENLSITNTVTGTNAVDLISTLLTNNSTSGTQQGLLIRNVSGSTGTTENLALLENADDSTLTAGLTIQGTSTGAITDAILIQNTSTGAITTALNVSDAEIATALAIGANDISTSAGNGLTVNCAASEFLQDPQTQAGIVVAGTCATAGGGGTLQSAYEGGNSITTADVDGGILFNLADTTSDQDFIVDILGTGNTFEVRDGGVAFVTFADGGVTTINDDVDLTLAGTENLAVTSDLGGSVDILSVVATPSASAGTTNGFFIQQASSANTNGLDAGITIDNADADLAITDGIIFTSAAGGITDAIDLTDTDIVNALNVGDNVILGTTPTINFTNVDVAGDGSFTWAVNSATNGIFNLSSTGDFLVQDAGGTFLTLSDTGGFDLTLDATDNPAFLVTDNGSGNITFNVAGSGSFNIQDGASNSFRVLGSDGSISLLDDVDFNLSQTENVDILNTNTTDISNDIVTIRLQDTSSASTGTRNILVVQNQNVAGAGTPDALAIFDQADTDETVADGVVIQTAGAASSGLTTALRISGTGAGTITDAVLIQNTSTGAITTALNASDAEIGTALAIGANDISTSAGNGLTVTCSGGNFLQNQQTQAGVTVAGTCAAGGSTDLQGAYVAGNTITTTEADGDISFTLADTTTDRNFSVDIVADNTITFARTNNASTEAPAQLVLIKNNDTDLTIADGLRIESENASRLTDAIDASDPEIDNAINVGANTILGTTAVVDFTNFDLAGDGSFTWGVNSATSGIFNLQSTGDFIIQDAGTAVLTVADDSSFTYALPAGTVDFSVTGLDADSQVIFSGLNSCDTIDTTAGGALQCGTDAGGGGGTAWSGITAPTANLSLAHADFTTSFTFDTASDVARDYFKLAVTNDLGTDTTTQNLFVLENTNEAGSTGTQDSLLLLNNADANEAVPDAILIQSAAGAITDAIDLTDTDIVNAINIGDNVFLGTTPTIDFTNIDIAGDGSFTWGVASGTSGIFNLSSTGDFIIQDAGSTAFMVDDGGVTQIAMAFQLTGDISPSQLTADQNDYNPTNLATSSVVRVSSDASRNITGLAGGADGRIIIVQNVSTAADGVVVLKSQSSSSTAANRFALDGDKILEAGESVILQYDSTDSRWRQLANKRLGNSSFRRRAFEYTDFLNQADALAATSNEAQWLPWDALVLSSGTDTKVAGTANHPGILRCTSSTTANSGCRVMWGDLTAMTFGGGETAEFTFLIDTLTNLTFRLGFHDATTSADAADGAYIEIPSTGAAVCKTANASSRTTSSTIATLSTATWYTARITVDATAANVTCEIFSEAGNSLGSQTNSANIPTTNTFGHGFVATNAGTTATNLIQMDYMSYEWLRALTR